MQNPIDFNVADVYAFTSIFDELDRLGALGSFDTVYRGLFPANNTHNLQEQYVAIKMSHNLHQSCEFEVSRITVIEFCFMRFHNIFIIYTGLALDILGPKARTKMGLFLHLCIN